MKDFYKNLAETLAHSAVYFSNPHGVVLYAGGDPAPRELSETTPQMLQALTEGLPSLMQAINSSMGPNEQAKLDASRQVSPGYSELQQQIYDTIGRQMNKTGQDIARENAVSQAGTDLEVLQGPGAQLVKEGLEAAKLYDPEYFSTRERTAAGLEELFKPGLTGGEREEVTRSLARDSAGRGTLTTPSNTKTVANAMTYGGAARDRLASAISQANNSLPNFRSGVDVFQVATGRPSAANSGDQKFMGTQTNLGESATASVNGLMGQISDTQRNSMNINANRRNVADMINQGVSAVGQVASCCFIFMEAYNGRIPWWVRASRDLHYTEDIRRGYVIMSRLFVPLMRKSKLARAFINHILIEPLTAHAGWLYSVKGYSHGKQYDWLNNVWIRAWTLLGRYAPKIVSYGTCKGIAQRVPFVKNTQMEFWHVPADTYIPRHSHSSCYSRLMPVWGQAEITRDDKKAMSKLGKFYHIGCGVVHSVRTTAAKRFCFFNFQRWTKTPTSASVDFQLSKEDN